MLCVNENSARTFHIRWNEMSEISRSAKTAPQVKAD